MLAEHAGHRCSVPSCNKGTIGRENNNKYKSSNTGMACHIYAASENGPRFKSDETKEFIKSMLFGNSGVGKTLIAQWLQTLCIGDIAHDRLTYGEMILSNFSLKYSTDSENEAQIQIENNKITRHVNDTIIVDPFFDIRVIYIPFIHPSYDESINNLDYVSKSINIPKHIIKQLESEINRTEFKLSKGDISFKNENIILSSYYNTELSSLTFNNLSSGECDAICIEIVCAYARQSAMRVPTLLILDIDGASLHTKMKK